MVKMLKVRCGIIIILILFASLLSAQVTNDFGLWVAATVNKDISKDIDISVEQEFRFEENAAQLGKSYTTLGLDYKLRQWLRLGVNYRFILNKGGDGEFGHRHRIMGDVILKSDIQRVALTNRTRLESEVRTVNYSAEYGFSPASNLRNTSKIAYKINRKYEPYASIDFRFLVRDAREPGFRGFDRHRIRLGVDILLAENRGLDLYLMTSRHWNITDIRQLFVIGIDITFGSDELLLGY